MRRTLAAAVLALGIPAVASAHITVSPPFVEGGVEAEIAFETPNERSPHATTTVSVTAPPGIVVVSATAPAGWFASSDGSTVTWSGGRLETETPVAFPMRVIARVDPGTYPFAAVQTYDDGATVDWKSDLQVLPGPAATVPDQRPWGAMVAGLAVLLVIAGSLVLVLVLRRRSLQDR